MLIHGDSPFPPSDDADDARQGAPVATARWLAVASAALVAVIAVSRLVSCACTCGGAHRTDIASAQVGPAGHALPDA